MKKSVYDMKLCDKKRICGYSKSFGRENIELVVGNGKGFKLVSQKIYKKVSRHDKKRFKGGNL